MRFGAVLAGALLIGCGEGTNNQGVVKGTVKGGVMSLPVSVEGAAAMPFVVDTGSPLTLVDPTKFAGLGIQNGDVSQVSTLDVGTLHLTDVEVVAKSPCGLMVCPATEPAGLLGGDVLVDFAVSLDYRAAAAAFGSFPLPNKLAPPMMTGFALEGGGQIVPPGMLAAMPLPATRISIQVTIEGTAHPFVLDTGSSALVLGPALYDSIVADGRPQSSVSVSTVSGNSNEPSTRLGSVIFAGEEQQNVEAIKAPLDLSTLEKEVGHSVEGLLGGAFLEHYLLTIDYPAREITLRAYQ
jgi:hypothetical protein